MSIQKDLIDTFNEARLDLDRTIMGDKGKQVLENLLARQVHYETIKLDAVDYYKEFEFAIDDGRMVMMTSGAEARPTKQMISNIRRDGRIHATTFNHLLEYQPETLVNLVNDSLRGDYMNKTPNLFRMYRGDNGAMPVARSAHSAYYKPIDDLHLTKHLIAAMAESGRRVELAQSPGITDTEFHLKFSFPDLRQEARAAFKEYRPKGGRIGDAEAIVGFALRNSEVGATSAAVAPFVVALVCTNGMIGEREAAGFRHAHRGAKQDLGFQYSPKTRRLGSEFAAAQSIDMVKAVSNSGYLSKIIESWSGLSEAEVVDPMDTAMGFGKLKLELNEDNSKKFAEEFLGAGMINANGLIQAATSMVRDGVAPEDRYAMESAAWKLTMDTSWVSELPKMAEAGAK